VHTAFVALLISLLVASVTYFAIMGLVQHRRARGLARKAHRMNLRFSRDDPFDIPRRYARFTLMNGGHSPRASNVMHGRIDGRLVRGFDFHFEIGHGTRRLTRHYGVIIVETNQPVPRGILWSRGDSESAPLVVRRAIRSAAGDWISTGSHQVQSILRENATALVDKEISVETGEAAIMFYIPIRRRKQSFTDSLEQILVVGKRIGSRLSSIHSSTRNGEK